MMKIEIQSTPQTPKLNRFESLAHTYFTPALPGLGEVLQCLAPHLLANHGAAHTLRALRDTHTFNARKSWEMLAARGLIPAQWIDAPHRWFRWHKDHLDPQSSTQAAILASNVPQLLTVEALAWEMASRLTPFGLPTPKRIFWSESRERGAMSQKTPPIHEPWLGFQQMLFEARINAAPSGESARELDRVTLDFMTALRDLASDKPALRDPLLLLHLEDLWEIASRYDWLICDSPALFLDGNRTLPSNTDATSNDANQARLTASHRAAQTRAPSSAPAGDIVARPFSDFANPFTPLTTLWRLGFGCAGFMRSCLVLSSPLTPG